MADSAPKQKPVLDAYKVHVAKMLGLAGRPAAKLDAAAADVVAIEVDDMPYWWQSPFPVQ